MQGLFTFIPRSGLRCFRRLHPGLNVVPRTFFAIKSRSFSGSPQAAVSSAKTLTPWGPEKFRLVPFVKEELRQVIREVPDVHYYYIGDENPGDYPYKDIALTEPIPLDVSWFLDFAA